MLGIKVFHIEVFEEVVEIILSVHQPGTIGTLRDLGLLTHFGHLSNQAFHNILQGHDTLYTPELIRHDTIFHAGHFKLLQSIIHTLVLRKILCRAYHLFQRKVWFIKPSFTIALVSSSVTLFSSFALIPVIFITRAVLLDNNQTKGKANFDKRYIGLATSIETRSA